MSHQELSGRHNVNCSFLQALQIRSSLPFTWRQLITTSATQNLLFSLQIRTSEETYLDITDTPSKGMYLADLAQKGQ